MLTDKACVLSGGTGTPKLLQALFQIISPQNLSIVANTADDLTVGDIYVCPDVDAVLYTLAGIIDTDKWYGIRNDSYSIYQERLSRGEKDLLRIGDRDRANCAFRTKLLNQGYTLSQAVLHQCQRLGIHNAVWPMTDSKVTTRIKTPDGMKEFQEFWVRDGGKDQIQRIEFDGLRECTPSPRARSAMRNADTVIIGPSNPITSIGPIIGMPGVQGLLAEKKVVAISPIRRTSPFSGPAGQMLKALGYRVSPLSICEIYRGFLDCLLIDTSDSKLGPRIDAEYGIRVETVKLLMENLDDKFKLAKTALGAAEGEKNGR